VMAQFTIHFDPSLLNISDIGGVNVNPDVILGDRLPPGTRVIVNTSRILAGDIGIVVYFNGSGRYPANTGEAGTRTLVYLNFAMTEEVKLGSVAPLTFSDDVFVTRIGDEIGQPLPVQNGLRGGSVVVTGSRGR